MYRFARRLEILTSGRTACRVIADGPDLKRSYPSAVRALIAHAIRSIALAVR